MKKKLAILGMTILIMTGVCGCVDRHEKNNEEMLAHMQEKYGVEFEIQSYIPRNVDCSYDVWYCNAVGDDKEQGRIEVHRYYGELAEDGKYADTYYTRLVRDEVERRAVEAIQKSTERGKAYITHFAYADEEYTKKEQLDEYLQTDKGRSAFGMLIYIADYESKGNMYQDVVEELQKNLLEAGIGIPQVKIFFVKNDEIFQEIDRTSQYNMIYLSGEEQIYTCKYSGNISRELKKGKE